MKKYFIILLLIIPLVNAEDFVYLSMNGVAVGETVSYDVKIGETYVFEAKGDSGLTDVVLYIDGENNLQYGKNPKISWIPSEEKIYELDIIGRKENEKITSQKFYLTSKKENLNIIEKPRALKIPGSEEYFEKCDYIQSKQQTYIFDLEPYNVKIGFASDNSALPPIYYKEGLQRGDFAAIYDEKNKILNLYFYDTKDKDHIHSVFNSVFNGFLNDPCSGFWNALIKLK